MASTYTPIATVTISGTPSSYTFSSVPQTYTDLILIRCAPSNSGGIALGSLHFNGDTAGNYSFTRLTGDGSSASSDSVASYGGIASGLSYSGQFTEIWNIMNYSNTTTYKTTINKSPVVQSLVRYGLGVWKSTAAINSVTINDGNTAFATGGTITLYGILAA